MTRRGLHYCSELRANVSKSNLYLVNVPQRVAQVAVADGDRIAAVANVVVAVVAADAFTAVAAATVFVVVADSGAANIAAIIAAV